jgi:hypothetical protein
VLPKIRNKGVASRSTAYLFEEETQEPHDPEDFPLGLLIDFACLVFAPRERCDIVQGSAIGRGSYYYRR